MQTNTTTNLQANFNGKEDAKTSNNFGNKIMCLTVNKTEKSKPVENYSLQEEYEKIISSNISKNTMCVSVNNKEISCGSVVDNTTICSPNTCELQNSKSEYSSTRPQIYPPSYASIQKTSYSSDDNIAETVKKFDEEQKEQLKKKKN